MDIREQITEKLHSLRVTTPWSSCAEHYKELRRKEADQILALGLVELDPDQTPPENPYKELQSRLPYFKAQQDYKDQGWRKVVTK